VIDPRIIAALDAQQVACCLIGAQALAAWGVARYTADIDLLTMSSRVLERGFWGTELAPEIAAIRRGDAGDPLAGVVRFTPQLGVDVIVGRGPIMRDAVATAVPDALLKVPVATPVALALLKLEAGGPQDLADIVRLVDAQRILAPGLALVEAIEAQAGTLSEWGQCAWTKVGPEVRSPGLHSRPQ
jgi:hypothetical protein